MRLKLIWSGYAFCWLNFAVGQLSDEQMKKADSLNLVVRTSTDDSVRVMTLLKWDNLIYNYHPDKSLELNAWAVAICDSNLQQPLSESRRAFFERRRANCIHNIGISYYFAAEYENAIQYFKLSLDVQLAKKDSAAIASGLNNIGAVYVLLGNLPRALEYHEQALAIRLAIRDSAGIAQSYSNIGSVYSDLGDYKKAFEHDVKSLHLYEILADSTGVGMCCNNLGNVFERQQKYTEAILFYKRSLVIQETSGHRLDYALLLNNIGQAYLNLLQFGDAQSYLQKALDIRSELGDKLGVANSYANLSALKRDENSLAAAIDFALKSVAIAREINMPFQLRSALQLLVYQYAASNQPSLAKACGTEVIELNLEAIETNFIILSEKEKELYFRTLLKDYALYYSFVLLYKDQLPELTVEVYNTTLTNKGLLLKSSTAMRNAILSSGDKELIEKYNAWINLKKKIARQYGTGTDLSGLEQQADSLERDLVRDSYFFSDLQKVKNLSWIDVQNGLKANEAAVEFIHFKREKFVPGKRSDEVVYCALVVKPESKFPEMIELFEEKELKRHLGTLQGNNLTYIEKLYGKKSDPNDSLYNLIWKPLEKTLDGIKRIYYSPTGLLHKISMAGLSVSADVFLCDKHELYQQSSTGKLATEEHFALNQSVETSIFGGIDYNSDCTRVEIWNYLEGTETEGMKITRLFDKKNQPVAYYSSSAATEEKFKSVAANSDIIHVATHGFFYPDPEELKASFQSGDEEEGLTFRGGNRAVGYSLFLENRNPLMRSGLVLAGANDVWNRTAEPSGDDGVLTAEEVIHLDLRKTQLVVLSACETGLGDLHDCEGVYGLQRAFKMAGVKYLVMSLWQVPDKETAEFMTNFYKRLLAVKNVRDAFSQTQQVMRKKYDPYYWAAFTLIE